MQLYYTTTLLGELSDYGYETPWATARIAPADPTFYKKLCAASRFLSVDIEEDWGDLTREEEDREYDRRLAAYAITPADLELFQSGPWVVRNSTQLQGPIQLHECDEDGWVTWRWI